MLRASNSDTRSSAVTVGTSDCSSFTMSSSAGVCKQTQPWWEGGGRAWNTSLNWVHVGGRGATSTEKGTVVLAKTRHPTHCNGTKRGAPPPPAQKYTRESSAGPSPESWRERPPQPPAQRHPHTKVVACKQELFRNQYRKTECGWRDEDIGGGVLKGDFDRAFVAATHPEELAAVPLLQLLTDLHTEAAVAGEQTGHKRRSRH